MDIAIDFAHSAYKGAVAGDQSKTATVPTLATLTPAAKMHGVRNARETEVYAGGQYIYLSERGDQPHTNAQAFMDTWHSRALLYATLAKLLEPGEHTINLVAAIPVAPLMADSARATVRAMVKWLQAQHTFAINRKDYTVTIRQCLVRPQPTGAFYEFALDDFGYNRLIDDSDINLRYAVVDAGSNTLDVCCMERSGSNLWPLPELTSGASLGMSWAAQRLKALISERGQSVSQAQADALLLQYIKRGSARTSAGLDINALAQAALDEWRAQAVEFVNRLWKQDNGAAVTLITGGGAHLLRRDIQYRNVTVLSDPVTANARGLAKYARREGIWK